MIFYLMMGAFNVASVWYLLQQPLGVETVLTPPFWLAAILTVFTLAVLRSVFWIYIYPFFERGGIGSAPELERPQREPERW